jgi:adenylosuccinate lyase
MDNELCNLSPIDGRYHDKVNELRFHLSEFGLIKKCVFVEIKWLIFLADELKLFQINDEERETILSIASKFSPPCAQEVKIIEYKINHNVKAVEIYVKEQLREHDLDRLTEWVHFACTSEDITNNAYALMIKSGRAIVIKALDELIDKINLLAIENKSVPMMSHTHGQPATPTTVGKEFVNFSWRLHQQREKLINLEIEGKINGASGNFNAHHFCYPKIDWILKSQQFIRHHLKIEPQIWSTQINNYSSISEMLHIMVRISRIVMDFDLNMWLYISMEYFKQIPKAGEVGSSTMPHKINPIDFENSEGNMDIGIAIMEKMATKLLVSRLQRDLTDSTVLRNLGSCFAHMLIGLKSTLKGLNKIQVNEKILQFELDNNWELMAEAIQTDLRMRGISGGYDLLKELTRGKKITKEDMIKFIESLSERGVPAEIIEKLKLGPSRYTGLAEQLVDFYFQS